MGEDRIFYSMRKMLGTCSGTRTFYWANIITNTLHILPFPAMALVNHLIQHLEI